MEIQQTTNTILMVRPTSFRMNEQTADNNYYRKDIAGIPQEELQQMDCLGLMFLLQHTPLVWMV